MYRDNACVFGSKSTLVEICVLREYTELVTDELAVETVMPLMKTYRTTFLELVFFGVIFLKQKKCFRRVQRMYSICPKTKLEN